MKTTNLPTKPKVDVKAIMAKASKKIESVKHATEKMDAAGDGWRLIPTFTKYEIKGNIIRNATTKRPMSPKAKNSKYQLIGDDGKNYDRTKAEIVALLPATEVKKESPKKASPKKSAPAKAKKPDNSGMTSERLEIKYHHVPKPMALDKIKNPKARAIMADESLTSKAQVEGLFFLGLERPEIVEITGRRDDVIAKYVRHLKR